MGPSAALRSGEQDLGRAGAGTSNPEQGPMPGQGCQWLELTDQEEMACQGGLTVEPWSRGLDVTVRIGYGRLALVHFPPTCSLQSFGSTEEPSRGFFSAIYRGLCVRISGILQSVQVSRTVHQRSGSRQSRGPARKPRRQAGGETGGSVSGGETSESQCLPPGGCLVEVGLIL